MSRLEDPRWSDLVARLWDRFDRSGGPDSCHPWTGSIGSHGYGQLSVGGRPELVHRLVYIVAIGDIPIDDQTGKTLVVDHICHNDDLECPGGKGCYHRPCGNPNHLAVKTNGDNRKDSDRLRSRGSFVTHCPKGHEYTEENTQWANQKKKDGTYVKNRRCAQCNRDKAAAYKKNKRQSA